MKFSASELVKRSASQLLYKELKKLEWKTTPGQIKGDMYAEEIVKKEEGSAEKRGIIKLQDDDLLFFCIDMVKDNLLIEIKSLQDEKEFEDWYLHSSIIQSTFYSTMATKVSSLDTPKFRKKEGYQQEIISVPSNFEFQLWFGNDRKFKIFPDERIYQHYLNKIKIIKEGIVSNNFDNCRKFDQEYKFKEFSIYKPKYKILN